MRLPADKMKTSPPGRSGFTLVELLVVMLIIIVLVGLTASGIFQVIDGQKQANTEQTIRVLYKALKEQMDRVVKDAQNTPPSPTVLSMAGNDPNRAQVLTVKFRLKQEFPQNFAEVFNPNPLPAKTQYVETLNKLGVTQAGSSTQLCEPSVCLLLILGQARSGIDFNQDLLGAGAIQGGSYNDPSNGVVKVKQIVDGWGQPLRFQRWPTQQNIVSELDAQNPTAAQKGALAYLYQDQQDPDGFLVNNWWSANQSDRQNFENWCHSLSNAGGTAPESHNRKPIIWSIGRSGQTNLLDPLPDVGFIYSYRLRTGDKGD
jgi:prepilin-type N-terminal cleavage/methylation domain-containing protein